MEVTELIQCDLQIRALTRHRAKGWQAAASPMAFGNSDMTAGSKVDFASPWRRAVLWDLFSPLLLLISLLWYGKIEIALPVQG